MNRRVLAIALWIFVRCATGLAQAPVVTGAAPPKPDPPKPVLSHDEIVGHPTSPGTDIKTGPSVDADKARRVSTLLEFQEFRKNTLEVYRLLADIRGIDATAAGNKAIHQKSRKIEKLLSDILVYVGGQKPKRTGAPQQNVSLDQTVDDLSHTLLDARPDLETMMRQKDIVDLRLRRSVQEQLESAFRLAGRISR